MVAIEMISSVEGGRFKRLVQILSEKLPLLYIKFGDRIFDDDAVFDNYMKDIIDVRRMLDVIESVFSWDDRHYLTVEILKYVDPNFEETLVSRRLTAVDTLTAISGIDRFNTILDIGGGDGSFIVAAIEAGLTKYGVVADVSRPDELFDGVVSLDSQILQRIEYRQCDAIMAFVEVPDNSLITSFYMTCDSTDSLKAVVDVAVENDTPLIIANTEIGIITDYALRCGMECIYTDGDITAVFI